MTQTRLANYPNARNIPLGKQQALIRMRGFPVSKVIFLAALSGCVLLVVLASKIGHSSRDSSWSSPSTALDGSQNWSKFKRQMSANNQRPQMGAQMRPVSGRAINFGQQGRQGARASSERGLRQRRWARPQPLRSSARAAKKVVGFASSARSAGSAKTKKFISTARGLRALNGVSMSRRINPLVNRRISEARAARARRSTSGSTPCNCPVSRGRSATITEATLKKDLALRSSALDESESDSEPESSDPGAPVGQPTSGMQASLQVSDTSGSPVAISSAAASGLPQVSASNVVQSAQLSPAQAFSPSPTSGGQIGVASSTPIGTVETGLSVPAMDLPGSAGSEGSPEQVLGSIKAQTQDFLAGMSGQSEPSKPELVESGASKVAAIESSVDGVADDLAEKVEEKVEVAEDKVDDVIEPIKEKIEEHVQEVEEVVGPIKDKFDFHKPPPEIIVTVTTTKPVPVIIVPPVVPYPTGYSAQQQQQPAPGASYPQQPLVAQSYPVYPAPKGQLQSKKCLKRKAQLDLVLSELAAALDKLLELLEQKNISYMTREAIVRRITSLKGLIAELQLAINLGNQALLIEKAKLVRLELIRLSGKHVIVKLFPELKVLTTKFRRIFASFVKLCSYN